MCSAGVDLGKDNVSNVAIPNHNGLCGFEAREDQKEALIHSARHSATLGGFGAVREELPPCVVSVEEQPEVVQVASFRRPPKANRGIDCFPELAARLKARDRDVAC